jgi:hypothetical protein
MSAGRGFHTATLLGNGKVLVAGGISGGGILSSADLYDPTTNTWSFAAPMSAARWEHTATLLGNGKVLVAGGDNDITYLASAELYDPATDTWSPAAPMSTARVSPTATLLGNGQVLVAGGSGHLSSAELYDPASNSWSTAGSMSAARWEHTATLLGNGKVLVAGGDNVTYLASAELYDPGSNSWSPAGTMSAARAYHTATLLGNGEVLVAGGANDTYPYALSSAELYVPDAVAPTVTAQPSDQAVTAGDTASFTAAAAGDPAPTVQWQVSTDGGASFADLAGATAPTLSFVPTSVAATGNLYRAVFTNSAGSATTAAAALTVSPAAADHLLFLQGPTDTAAGQTIGPAVLVAVVDRYGNVVTSDNSDTVTLSIGTNPGGGTLSGTLTVTVVNGVATFGDLSIDTAGAGYTLHATAGGALADADSDPFNVTP